jgi:hypothetical protein
MMMMMIIMMMMMMMMTMMTMPLQAKPSSRRVEECPSFSTLTPYYNEDVILSMESLLESTAEGVTTLEYLQASLTRQASCMPHQVIRRTTVCRTNHYVSPLYALLQRGHNVMLSMESLLESTAEGVTTLEYLQVPVSLYAAPSHYACYCMRHHVIR